MAKFTAPKFTTPEHLGRDMQGILKALAVQGEEKATKTMKTATANLFTGIIVGTPVWFTGEGEGTARGSWFINKGAPAADRQQRDAQKGRSYARRKLKDFKMGQRWFMSNSVPYINVLEFGGYPKAVKKGSWSNARKAYVKRSAGGFSKQAPAGMVRKNLLQWRKIIASAIRANP